MSVVRKAGSGIDRKYKGKSANTENLRRGERDTTYYEVRGEG